MKRSLGGGDKVRSRVQYVKLSFTYILRKKIFQENMF